MRWHKAFSLLEFLIFLVALSLFLFFVYFYFYGMSHSFTNKGIKLLKEKNFLQAQNNFHLALAEQKFKPWPYLNVALGYDLLKTPDKALKTYGIVSSHLKEKSNTALFYAYFNKGELYGRLKQITKALKNYQQALDFEYKEKEIKTNIELLFQTDQKSQSQKDKKSDKARNQNSEQNQEEQNEKGASDKKEENQTGQKSDKEQAKPQQKEQSDQNQEQEQKEFDTDQTESKQEDNKAFQQGREQALKELNRQQEEAIFEEVEKQENNVRSKIYQRKNIFGDKALEDW